MLPRLNHRRALFVLTKIGEILSWEKKNEAERDTRFVELGRYLCEVRAGQYWRVDNVRSFDEFLERKFPESRRKAYYDGDSRATTSNPQGRPAAGGLGEGDRTSEGGEEGWSEV